MALNAFGMPTADKRPQRLSPKQVQAALRKQRQDDARRIQAERDRARERQRQAERERNNPKQDEKNDRPIIDTIPPRGKKYSIDEIEWLDQYSGEEREKKEQELLQSLRDRGVFTFVDGGRAAWIENTYKPANIKIDLSPTAKGIYSNEDFASLRGEMR